MAGLCTWCRQRVRNDIKSLPLPSFLLSPVRRDHKLRPFTTARAGLRPRHEVAGPEHKRIHNQHNTLYACCKVLSASHTILTKKLYATAWDCICCISRRSQGQGRAGQGRGRAGLYRLGLALLYSVCMEGVKGDDQALKAPPLQAGSQPTLQVPLVLHSLLPFVERLRQTLQAALTSSQMCMHTIGR